MKINQLFRKPVDLDIMNDLLHCFDLTGIDDTRTFTKYEMYRSGCVQKVCEMLPRLQDIYLPCKAKVYLVDITEKRAVTILKQMLRLFNRNVISRERNVMSVKMIVYQIMDHDMNSLHGIHISRPNVIETDAIDDDKSPNVIEQSNFRVTFE